MKKAYYVFIILLAPLLLLILAYSSGAPPEYTGSPLDGQDCSSCHLPGPATNIDNLITTTIPIEGYTPGETYTVVLSSGELSAEKFGFQITSETVTSKTGSWIITNSTRTKLAGTAAVTHTLAGTNPSGVSNNWTMDWTAPAEGTGQVMFYAAVNKTNNSGSNSGDEIYTSMLTVEESTIGVPELAGRESVGIYPNPATERINVVLPPNSIVNLLDNSGRMIRSIQSVNEMLQIDVSNLEQGIYYLQIKADNINTAIPFIKK